MNRIKETRKQILATAKFLFQEYGFDKTSLDEIARAAHKAKRSLYNHFGSKEEIYTVVLEEELCNMQTALEHIFNDESLIPPKRIHNYLIWRMEMMNEAKTIQQLLKNRVAGHDEDVEHAAGLFYDFKNVVHLQGEYGVRGGFAHVEHALGAGDAEAGALSARKKDGGDLAGADGL